MAHGALPPGVSAHGMANLGMPMGAPQEQAKTGDDEDLAMLKGTCEAGQLPLKDYVTMKAMLRMSRRPRSQGQPMGGGVGSGLDFSNGELDPASMIHGGGLRQMRARGHTSRDHAPQRGPLPELRGRMYEGDGRRR